jgi:hypothetical protein
MLIEDMLSDLGCEAVTTAATVPQALTLIGAQVFDGSQGPRHSYAAADQTPVRPWSDQPAINDCRQAEVMN